MKRYNWVDTTVEGSPDEYVDADIAQELYDALKTAMKYFDQVIIETGYQSEGEAIAHNKCKQALSNADKD